MRAPTCFPWRGPLRDGHRYVALPWRHVGPHLQAILDRAPVSPVRLNPDLPPKFEDIVNKALEKDRNLLSRASRFRGM